MASLLQIRDTIALHGIVEARQLSLQLMTPLRLINAMLEQLIMMGKIERIEKYNPYLTRICKRCTESSNCERVLYRLRKYPL